MSDIYQKKYPQGYYVYAYIRNKTTKNGRCGTPYYIGKGKHKRAWLSSHNVGLPTDSWRIVVIAENLTEIGALALERRLIRFWGRLDLNTGCLYNLTDGGEGTSGYRHTEETKERISKKGKGRKASLEERRRSSEARKGKPFPGSTIERAKKLKGRKWFNNGEIQQYLQDCPEGWVRGRLTKPRKDPTKPRKQNPHQSMESNLKRSMTLKGKAKSLSHSQNISKARKGIVFSDEHKAKLKEARRARAIRESLKKKGMAP